MTTLGTFVDTSGYVKADGSVTMTSLTVSGLITSGSMAALTLAANIRLNGNYLSGDGGDEGISVDASGNVGINVLAPATTLDVRSKATNGHAYFAVSNSDASKFVAILGGQSGSSPFFFWKTGDYLQVGVADNSVGGGFTEKLRISATGQLGIGKTPASLLDVNGTAAMITALFADATEQTSAAAQVAYIASDTLRNSNDTEKTTASATYVKVKEVLLNAALPVCRLKFDLATSLAGTYAYAQIQKDAVVIGTEQSNNSETPATKSEDFTSFASGVKIQIYAHCDATHLAKVTNMRFYYDRQITIVAGYTLTTPLAITSSAISMTNQDP